MLVVVKAGSLSHGPSYPKACAMILGSLNVWYCQALVVAENT